LNCQITLLSVSKKKFKMKKILLTMSFVAITIASNAQVQRTVLIEEFTNASCGPCASQNPNFNALLANNPTKVVQIKYQTVWPGADPMNAQNQADVATRVTKYAVDGVPYAVIDADTLKLPATTQAYAGAPAGVNQAKIDAEYAITSPISIIATYSYNATTDSFTSVVTIKNETANPINASVAGNLRLQFELLEMNINYATAPGSNGETEFYYVMRKMYPSAAGTTLPNTLAPGTPYTFTFKEKAPTYIYKKPQMAVAVFVEDMGTATFLPRVYQSKLALPPNTIDLKGNYTGTTTSTNYCASTVNPSIVITNNGTTPITSATIGYTLNGAGGTTQNWTGNLTAGQSATITMPAIVAPVGTNLYEFSITNINGGNIVDLNESNNTLNPTITFVVGNAVSPFSESFESSVVGSSATSQSLINLRGGSTVVDKTILTSLTQKLGGFGLSDKSYRFRFFSVPDGNRIGLVFYKNNIQNKGFSTIEFDHAYNNYIDANGTLFDTLSVQASTDCGSTWTEIWIKSGDALRTTTVTPTNLAYYPLTTEWVRDVAPLPASMKNATELLIKFEGQSGFGNNLYIDNIKFSYPLAVENQDLSNIIDVFPNPTSGELKISGITGDATFSFTDVLGRIIKSETISNISQVITLNTNGLPKGNYSLKISQAGKSISKKVTIID
jgi:hypothetical protein